MKRFASAYLFSLQAWIVLLLLAGVLAAIVFVAVSLLCGLIAIVERGELARFSLFLLGCLLVPPLALAQYIVLGKEPPPREWWDR